MPHSIMRLTWPADVVFNIHLCALLIFTLNRGLFLSVDRSQNHSYTRIYYTSYIYSYSYILYRSETFVSKEMNIRVCLKTEIMKDTTNLTLTFVLKTF